MAETSASNGLFMLASSISAFTSDPNMSHSASIKTNLNSEAFSKIHYKYYILESESPENSLSDSESILSIQAKETDFVKDTSDTESHSSGYENESDIEPVEYEPTTEPEDDAGIIHYSSENSSGETDSEIIATKVISVAAMEEGDLEFADSEDSLSGADPELGLFDYWQCVQCRNPNNNPLFRYCEKCYKVRKNFFPPRPQRKNKLKQTSNKNDRNSSLKSNIQNIIGDKLYSDLPNGDSGIESAQNSQEFMPPTISELDVKKIKVPYSPSKQSTFCSDRRLKCNSNLISKASECDSTILTASNSQTVVMNTKVDQLIQSKLGVIDYDLPTTSQSVCDSLFRNNLPSALNDFRYAILDKPNKIKRKLDVETTVNSKKTVLNVTFSSSDSSSDDDNASSGNAKRSRLQNITNFQESATFSNPNNEKHVKVQHLTKTVSDPQLTIDNNIFPGKTNLTMDNDSLPASLDNISNKAIFRSLKQNLGNDEDNMCITCLVEPKSGVFAHGRIAHICCCYKCAVKVWAKTKRCPLCNCKVSNVLKAIVM